MAIFKKKKKKKKKKRYHSSPCVYQWNLIYLHTFVGMMISRASLTFRVLGSRSVLTRLNIFCHVRSNPFQLKNLNVYNTYLNVQVMHDLYFKVTGFLSLHSQNFYMSSSSPFKYLSKTSSLVRGDLNRLHSCYKQIQ